MIGGDFFKSRYLLFLLLSSMVVFSSVFFVFSEKYDGFTGMGGAASCGDVAWENCDLSCSAGTEIYVAGGSCLDPNICCRDLNYCGDTVVDPNEDCDTSDLDGNACTDLGFYGGTLACSSCSFDNSSCIGYCGDGTCDAEETCNGCPSDCDNVTGSPACSAGQICEVFMGSGGCTAAAPSVCSDGTSVNTCVVNGTPSYCDSNGTLVNNCTACACSGGYSCQGDGSCLLDVEVVSSGGGYSGVTYEVEDAEIVEVEVFVNTQIHAVVSSLTWEGVRRNDEISFEISQNSNNQPEMHSVEINRISGGSYVDITIRSDPMDVRLYEGESQEIDLDGDGVIDIIITATDVDSSRFNIDIQEYVAPIEDKIIVNEIEGTPKVYFEPPMFAPERTVEEYSIYGFILFVVFIAGAIIFMFINMFKEFKK
jgi:hypothetical protein